MTGPLVYIGLHQPADAAHFDLSCISIRRLLTRHKPVAGSVLVDSGAFTQLALHGGYPKPPGVYAGQLHRLHTEGVVRIAAAVAQDYMCEPFMLAKTGLTIADHQRLTIERYDALVTGLRLLFGGPPPFPVMPVLQGFAVTDYLRHLAMYGERLTSGMWVGVGSVCKRQGDPSVIAELLRQIKGARPDLRLHGFRREADRADASRRARALPLRRQLGLELQRPEAGTQRQRLARGSRLPHQDHSAGQRPRPARASVRAA